MRHFVIGTAGHVDHGKTTLVRALTGVDTDRLPEEKARGISIELGFAPLDLGDGLGASIVDVPGHRRLVRTMIAGAAGIELVMLVVAADEGVMPQTREHRALIVVNKADAVDAELAQLAGEEARALLGERWQASVVTCSAKTGEGIDRLKEALRVALRSLPAAPARAHPRLGVDRLFSVRGAGTVVTGTLVGGAVAAGDTLYVVGGKESRPTAARGLHVHDAAVQRAEAPTRLAINLAGVALDEVHRGDVVTGDAHLRPTRAIDLLVLGKHALKRGAAITAYAGTASTAARVDAVQAVDGGAVVRVRLSRSTPLAGGDRVVLRGGVGGPSGAVVGGGIVVDAHPDRRASGARRRALGAALATLDAGASILALVESCAPRPLDRASLAARFAIEPEALVRAADKAVRAGKLARVADAGWMLREHLLALTAQARALVLKHHEQAPLERGLPLETLRGRLGQRAGRPVAEEAIRLAASSGEPSLRLVVEGDIVRAAHVASPASQQAVSKADGVARAVQAASIAGAAEAVLAQKTGLGASDVRAALQKLSRDGSASRLGDLWFDAGVLAEARRRMVAHFATAPTLSVVQFKELTGTARKQAVLMLEHFDTLGLTRRQGDARVLR